MASNTPRLGLYKKDPVTDANDTFNIQTMLNDNWDKIDGKVAILGPDGKILSEQLPQQSLPTASTTQAGVVKLNTSTNSTSTSEAATPSAVKEVNDKVNEHSADTTKHVTQLEKDSWNGAIQKIGDLTMLNTTAKSNLVAAVNELFTNVSDGKQQVRDAITGKGGVVTDGDGDGIPSFQELADGVNTISMNNIKSVQMGVITGTYQSTSPHVVTTNISSVDTSKSIILCEMITNSIIAETDVTQSVIGKFDSNTKIAFETLTYSTSTLYKIQWMVIEFENVKSIQSGLSSGYGSIAISPININKSLLFYTQRPTLNTSDKRYMKSIAYISSNTSLSLYTYAPDKFPLVQWFIVEFN